MQALHAVVSNVIIGCSLRAIILVLDSYRTSRFFFIALSQEVESMDVSDESDDAGSPHASGELSCYEFFFEVVCCFLRAPVVSL